MSAGAAIGESAPIASIVIVCIVIVLVVAEAIATLAGLFYRCLDGGAVIRIDAIKRKHEIVDLILDVTKLVSMAWRIGTRYFLV